MISSQISSGTIQASGERSADLGECRDAQRQDHDQIEEQEADGDPHVRAQLRLKKAVGHGRGDPVVKQRDQHEDKRCRRGWNDLFHLLFSFPGTHHLP